MEPRPFGPFILLRQIGAGAMGVVYLAIYPQNGKHVAVKVLAPGYISDLQLVRRFERETEIVRRMKHPNIVKYHGSGTEEGQLFYAMEFLDGGSLQQKLRQQGRFTFEQTVNAGRQIASALEHSHNAGIIHRDLKPANLFVSKKGRLKLGDFGIARDNERTALTAAGMTVGTPTYMAPEQIQTGGFPVTGRTDLYSLGCVLYELVVGQTPFQGDSMIDVLQQQLHDAPYNVREKVPDCPVELDQLIDRLLEKHPDDRPYDAGAVHMELGAIREKLSHDKIALIETKALNQVSGESTATTEKKIKRKRKQKKKDTTPNDPLHERTWFLVTCFVALIVLVAVWQRPESEDERWSQWRADLNIDGDFQPHDALKKVNSYIADFPDGKHIDEALERQAELPPLLLEKPLKFAVGHPRPEASRFKLRCIAVIGEEIQESLIYVVPWRRVATSALKPAPPPALITNPLPVMQKWKELIAMGQSESLTDENDRGLIGVCINHHEYFREQLIASPNAYQYFRQYVQTAETSLENDEHDNSAAIWSYVASEFSGEESDMLKWFCHYAKCRASCADFPIPTKDQIELSAPTSGEATNQPLSLSL